ncbi:MAG: papain-like cysteine peptidase [Desertifilum sp.]|nr:papain-like cysteine peptidase [Desertifilum sp.]
MAKNIKLGIPVSLSGRVETELTFLGVGKVGNCITLPDGEEVTNRSSFLRGVTETYINHCLAGCDPSQHSTAEPNSYISFHLDNYTKGRWDYAIRSQLALTHSDLVTRSLVAYFERKERRQVNSTTIFQSFLSAPEDAVMTWVKTSTLPTLPT